MILLIALLLVAKLAHCVEVSKAPKLVDAIEQFNHPEGTNATVICSIGSGDLTGLTYEWFKDDKRIVATLNTGKLQISTPQENYNSILRVIDLVPADSGLYTCLAKNRFGRDKISTRLNVKVQLKWLMEPHDVQVAAGRVAEILCKAAGSPTPKIIWRKLDNDEDKDKEILGSELQFGSIKQQDAGLYECRASNGVDDDLVARIKLDVLGSLRVQFKRPSSMFFSVLHIVCLEV